MSDFVKVAHRGASGSCPENTRLAISRAIDAGADMIEIDCQLSKDGHVVVFHDERLIRTASTRGTVRGKTLKQLKTLDVGRWFKKSFKGESILTLEEAMEVIAGKADLNLDIKRFPRGPLGIELKILFILSHYDYLDRTLFASFDYRCLSRVRELAPDAKIGILYGKAVKEDPFDAARKLGARVIEVEKELATKEFISKVNEKGLEVFVWTVNDVREMEKFVSLGVNGIISDFPERFWKIKVRSQGSG